MNDQQRSRELGEFLRARRECLCPEEFGLSRRERRRVPGLRREEVAALSGVSIAWYTWLEQGRTIRPSAGALYRIGQTLRLTEDERSFVSLLIASDFGESSSSGRRDPAWLSAMQGTLDAFAATPAILYNTRFDVVAANAAARTVYGRDVASGTNWERNMLWRFFMDDERRQLYPDATADLGIRNLIEALRLNWVNGKDGDMVEELIDEMRSVSHEFDAIWRERKVAKLGIIPGRIQPPGSVRQLRVRYSRFYVPTMPGYAIAALIPSTSEDAAMLRRNVGRRS
ncbi:MAG: helix-turn-helix domain-containing protein [Acidobacteria bacterium]|nr:helix-turn-helix domain-containing protein [Acidobacteriota bacterium]